MQFTEKGQPYIFAPQARRIISLCSSHDEIETRFGPGIRRLFNFFILLLGVNIILASSSFIGWLLCIVQLPTFGWEQFFISSYPPDVAVNVTTATVGTSAAVGGAATVATLAGEGVTCHGFWFGFNIFNCVIWWLVGPIYFIWEKFVFRPLEAQIYTCWSDEIPENQGRTRHYWFSGIIMFTCLVISSVILYTLVSAQKTVSTSYGNVEILNIKAASLMGILVALGFSLCNLIWDHASFRLTQVEYNHTWFHFRVSHAIKLILFKLILGTVLFTLTAIVFQTPPDTIPQDNAPNNTSANEGGHASYLQESGINLFLSICVDIFVITCFVQNLAPILIRRIRIRWCGAREDNASLKPVFDISEELLAMLYRQFLLYLALMVVPLSGVLGIVGVLLQYFLVKFRLLYVCQPTQYIQEDLRWFLFGICSLIALAATLSYPNGIIWIKGHMVPL
jgi:hypothetical protein